MPKRQANVGEKFTCLGFLCEKIGFFHKKSRFLQSKL